MSVLQLSLNEARHLHLAAQGLLKKPRRRARPKDILSTIQQMSLLQIDTINVVARSPYLVLFSRLGSYPQHWLDESLRNGELMEYWAHEACFLPRSDFALGKTARFARRILPTRAKAPAAGGSGNRISATWKGCLPPAK